MCESHLMAKFNSEKFKVLKLVSSVNYKSSKLFNKRTCYSYHLKEKVKIIIPLDFFTVPGSEMLMELSDTLSQSWSSSALLCHCWLLSSKVQASWLFSWVSSWEGSVWDAANDSSSLGGDCATDSSRAVVSFCIYEPSMAAA